MTEISSPWSKVGMDFLSEGAWAYGQGPNAPDRQLFRHLLRCWLGDYDGEPKPTLLEVGFGSGIDVSALADEDLGDEIDYVGYDLTPEFVAHMREMMPGVGFEHGDVMTTKLPPADIVWCRHLLEHVKDGYIALANLWRATRHVLLVSWFIRPTWDEGDVRCDVSHDGFIHHHFSARRMIEFARSLGAHLYRFDLDHASTRASLWMLARESEPELCEEAHDFLSSQRFLRSVVSPPGRDDAREDAVLEVVADAAEMLASVNYEAQLRDELHDDERALDCSLLQEVEISALRAKALLHAERPLTRYSRLVLWGFTDSLDSMRHIMRAFAHAAPAVGLASVRLPDAEESLTKLRSGDLVLAVDVEGRHLRARSGVDYVLHNFDAEHPVWEGLDPWRFLRLQTYTEDAERYGVPWDPVRRYDRVQRTLFQPWGTDLLAEEFMEPVWNPESDEAAFVGAIWDDDGLGNAGVIDELKDVLEAAGLQFYWRTQVSDEVHISSIRSARIAPAFTGEWQRSHSYLPCRVFKNVSYGQLALTNVPKFRELFAGCSLNGQTLRDVVEEARALSEKDWREYVLAQQQVVARYTYRESLEAIGRALEEGKRE